MKSWPNGSRIAVAFTIMFETWSEGKAPQYSVQTTHLKPGAIDHSGITWAQYGGNVGASRLVRTFNRYGVKATFNTNARCAELYPEVMKQIVGSGHDVAGHGYTQDALQAYLEPDEEKAYIKKCLGVLEKVTGKRPQGWLCPVLAWTPHTTGFLADEGLLWQGDANYTDIPKLIEVNGKKIAHIPASEFSDNRVLKSSPRDFYDVYKDTFDYLYKNEPGSLLVCTLHCHNGGRPWLTAMLDELLQYYKTMPSVWFATHADIARGVLSGDIKDSTYGERYLAG